MNGFSPVALIWLIFVWITVANIKKGKAQSGKNSNPGKTPGPAHVPSKIGAIKGIYDQATKDTNLYVGDVNEEGSKGSISPKKPKMKTPKGITIEKTHSHEGEVSNTVLLEDRNNDWLARQIKEEARLRRKNFE